MKRRKLWLLVVLGACTGGNGSSVVHDGGADGGAGGIVVAPLPSVPTPSGLCTSCNACEEDLTITSEVHLTAPLDYQDPPPAGGDHNPCWSTWGVHAEAVPDDNWVHNLEHGGVVYLYNCPEGCDAEVTKLEELVTGRPQALLTPYPNLPLRFAAVSWGHRLVSDCFDAAIFDAFYTKRVDMAPESVPGGPPASCLGL